MMDNKAFAAMVAKGREKKKPIEKSGLKKKKRKRQWKPKKGQDQKKDKKDAPKYRDRALQRRKGLNPDYDKTAQIMGNISIEHSKLLGGDEAHTHLVKGLDKQLLERSRVKMQTELEELQATARSKQAKAKAKVVKKIKFNTHWAHHVYRHIAGKTRAKRDPHGHTVFSSQRMTFNFDLTEDATLDVPTTEMLSKDDVDSEMVFCDRLEEALLRRLDRAFSRKSKKKKKVSVLEKSKKTVLERKLEDLSKKSVLREADELVWSAPLQNEVDAIFPGLGNYEPTSMDDEN